MQTRTEEKGQGRFDYEADEMVRHLITNEQLQLSPEEYAAREGHNWGCFSYHLCQFRDPALGAWVRRLGEILGNEAELERCRQRFLTAEEQAVVRQRVAEPF